MRRGNSVLWKAKALNVSKFGCTRQNINKFTFCSRLHEFSRRRKARASEYNASLLAIVNERSRASHKANIAYYAMSPLRAGAVLLVPQCFGTPPSSTPLNPPPLQEEEYKSLSRLVRVAVL